MTFDEIKLLLRKIVIFARVGDYADASSSINILTQKIHIYLTEKKMAEDQLLQISYSFETLLMMQKQRDWVGVADVIEYELIALLER